MESKKDFPFNECKLCRTLDDCPNPDLPTDELGMSLPPDECPKPMNIMRRTLRKRNPYEIGTRIKEFFCKSSITLAVNDTDMKDLLHEVLSHFGMTEVDGPASNPEILRFFNELGYDWVNDDSTTAWCSAMLSYYAKKCGYQYHVDLDARGWLDMPVKVLKPSLGDIVILWRNNPASWQGHVGLFINWNETKVWLLGGNQNNQINITAYPRERILGIRQIKKLPS